MESYTFGSPEFMSAIALERMRTGENYPITLNDKDFRILTTILQQIAIYGDISRSELNDLVGWNGENWEGNERDIDPISDWAWNWLSGIGETLGVEGI
jgi:hypothetical protein